MKIVKQHKNRSPHSQSFGIFSGKVVAELNSFQNGLGQVTSGGLNGKLDYIKIGDTSQSHFIWIDDFAEAKAFGEKLIALSEEHERRQAE